MCAALANVEEDNWEWHTFDTVKGGDYLVDQDAAEIMAKEAIDAVLDLEKMGLPFNRTEDGKIDQRRFGGHTRNHGEAAVRRSCYAADRTGHMILQTLYQQCIKHDVEFFNEFYVLDLLTKEVNGGTASSASSPTSWPPARSTSSRPSRSSSPPAASARSSRRRPTRTPSPVTAWASSGARACRWRTWSSSSSTRPAWPAWASCSPRAPAVRAASCATARRALHGAVRAHHQGPRAPRHGLPGDLHEVREGRGCGPDKAYVYLDLTHLPPEQLDAKLPDITEFARTYLGIEPYTEIRSRSSADRALRHGRHPDQHRGRGARGQHTPWSRACTPPVRSPACRCTAPTASAPTRCSTSTSSAAAPASPPRSTPPTADYVELPENPEAMVSRDDRATARRRAAPSGSPRSAGAAGDDGRQRAGLPHRAARSSRRSRTSSARRATSTCRCRTRASGSTPTCSRRSSWASCSTWPRCWSSRRWPATSPAAVTTARTTRTATTSTSCATPWRTARTSDGSEPTRLQAGRPDPLPADGA